MRNKFLLALSVVLAAQLGCHIAAFGSGPINSGGGGGAGSLSATLAVGNTTGPSNISVNTGQRILGAAELQLTATTAGLTLTTTAAQPITFQTFNTSRWQIDLNGHLMSGAGGDGTYDIGSPDAGVTVLRPRDIYLKNSTVVQNGPNKVTYSSTGLTASLTPFTVTTTGANNITFVSGGSITCAGAGANSERFGLGAVAAGAQGVAFGNGASASNSDATAIGRNANAAGAQSTVLGNGSATATGGTALGFGATANGTNSTSIGLNANSGAFAGSITLGATATATAANQFVCGSNTTTITDVFFGAGPAAGTPIVYTIHGSGGTGAAVAGKDLVLAGGLSGDAATAGGGVTLGYVKGSAGTSVTNGFKLDNAGNVITNVAGVAIPQAAVNGFLYLPQCATGAPSGVPTAFTGAAPVVVGGDNSLYFYASAAWNKVATGSSTYPVAPAAGTATAGGTSAVAVGPTASAAGNQSLAVGNGASSSALATTAMGYLASANNIGNTSVGYSAQATGTSSCTAVGESAAATGARSTTVGEQAKDGGFADCVVLGTLSLATGPNQFVSGSSGASVIKDVYFGSGVSSITAWDFNLHGTGGSGTDTAAGSVLVSGGKGTGAGAAGSVRVQTSFPLASGSAVQGLGDRQYVFGGVKVMSLTSNTLQTFANITMPVGSIANVEGFLTIEVNDGTTFSMAGVGQAWPITCNGAGTAQASAPASFHSESIGGSSVVLNPFQSAAGAVVSLQVQPTWSVIVPTVVRLSWQLKINGAKVTVVPQ